MLTPSRRGRVENNVGRKMIPFRIRPYLGFNNYLRLDRRSESNLRDGERQTFQKPTSGPEGFVIFFIVAQASSDWPNSRSIFGFTFGTILSCSAN